MPRLLLVDDNPSIHRIAESLLSPTDVELVCVDSAAEALDRVARGEHFDVALVDTAMPGMDGWTLLERLRAMEATARMPIALMAGVLDPVDPAKLAKASIQGFLKKPIELRELGDRVKALLAIPVLAAPSPFITVPATPARDLIKRAEAALPEFRPEPEETPVAFAEAFHLPDPEEDLLLLTAEDLWPEEAVAPPVPELTPFVPEMAPSATAIPDVHLELEELDLESLQELPMGSLLEDESTGEAIRPEPAEAASEPMADLLEEEPLVTLSGLEEFNALPTEFQIPPPSAVEAEPADFTVPAFEDELADFPVAVFEEELADFPVPARETELADFPVPAPEAEPGGFMVPAAATTAAAVAAVAGMAALPHASLAPFPPEPAPEAELAAAGPAARGQSAAAPGQGGPVSSEQAQALLQALVADPVLVDALVRAVVARMGDQVIREIAWEVMPDLAGRLQR